MNCVYREASSERQLSLIHYNFELQVRMTIAEVLIEKETELEEVCYVKVLSQNPF